MADPEVTLTLSQALLEGRLTTDEAARALALSRRQAQRLKRRLQAGGPPLRHGNAARPPANKTPAALRQRALDLATTSYAHFNFCHPADILAEKRHILLPDETPRRWLRPLGHGRPLRRGRHRGRRTRRAREGELLFLDGSPHPWLGPKRPPCCLLPASDDAAGKPLGAGSSPRRTAAAASPSATRSSSASACPAPSTSTAPASSSRPATAARRPCTTPTASRRTSSGPWAS